MCTFPLTAPRALCRSVYDNFTDIIYPTRRSHRAALQSFACPRAAAARITPSFLSGAHLSVAWKGASGGAGRFIDCVCRALMLAAFATRCWFQSASTNKAEWWMLRVYLDSSVPSSPPKPRIRTSRIRSRNN